MRLLPGNGRRRGQTGQLPGRASFNLASTLGHITGGGGGPRYHIASQGTAPRAPLRGAAASVPSGRANVMPFWGPSLRCPPSAILNDTRALGCRRVGGS
eukprot:6179352-Pyramimonas_sp.AAC.1